MTTEDTYMYMRMLKIPINPAIVWNYNCSLAKHGQLNMQKCEICLTVWL